MICLSYLKASPFPLLFGLGDEAFLLGAAVPFTGLFALCLLQNRNYRILKIRRFTFHRLVDCHGWEELSQAIKIPYYISNRKTEVVICQFCVCVLMYFEQYFMLIDHIFQ